MIKIKKKRVFVALSGGVDSAAAAAILKEVFPASKKKGYGESFRLTGVFARLADTPRFKEGERRAKKIAKILKIPLLICDLKKEFKKKIIGYFLKEYKEGRTPNPCVVCNKEIKFGILLEKALKNKKDFLATGHYAILKEKRGGIHLYKARDREKDQSYFLWDLSQKQLKKVLFPLGNYKKTEVKLLVQKLKLPFLDISESQEVCFIQKTVNDFLKKNLKKKTGKIIERAEGGKSKALGKHEGLWFYTIGQRKGIGLSGGPYYVLEKNIKENQLVVTKREKDLYKKEVLIRKVDWISGKSPKLPEKLKVKIRYRHKAAPAVLFYDKKNKYYRLKFKKEQRAATPGQSAVFYLPDGRQDQKSELLGGGIIC